MSKNMVETEQPQMTYHGTYVLHAELARLHTCMHVHAHAPGYPHTCTRACTHRPISNTYCKIVFFGLFTSVHNIKLTPANSPKNTILHSEPGESFGSLILIAFPWQQWFTNAPQCYAICTLPLLLVAKLIKRLAYYKTRKCSAGPHDESAQSSPHLHKQYQQHQSLAAGTVNRLSAW
jgi:hypothetical protein